MTNRTKAIAWIVAVFLAGTLFGGGVAALVRPSPPPPGDVDLLDDPPQSEPAAQADAPQADPSQDAPRQQGPLVSPRQPRPQGPDHLQGGGRDGRGPGMRVAEWRRLSRLLNLTPDQRRELGGIFRRGQQRIKEMDREMHQRRSQIRREVGFSIRSILSPEQKQVFDEYLEDRRRERREKGRLRERPNDRRQRGR